MKKVKEKLLKMYKTLDPSGMNYEYYKKLFDSMSDKQFYDFFNNNKLPLRLHVDTLGDTITEESIESAMKLMDIPIFEKINIGYKYIDKETGLPAQTKDALVGYINVFKMVQMVSKGAKYSTDNITTKSAKTGEMVGESKIVAVTDRELEALAAMGLDETIKEFYTFRSDDTDNQRLSQSIIASKGTISMDADLSPAIKNKGREALFAYFTAAQLDTNLMEEYEAVKEILRKRGGRDNVN